LLTEYESLRGSKGVSLFFQGLKRLSRDNYKINISYILLRFYDLSPDCKETLKELGFGGAKDQVLRKIKIFETRHKIRKDRFDATYNQMAEIKKSFTSEVLTVRMALGGMQLDLEKMTAFEWVETVKLAKEHARHNNSERVNQSGRYKATR